jgi:dienelactone hydrolase
LDVRGEKRVVSTPSGTNNVTLMQRRQFLRRTATAAVMLALNARAKAEALRFRAGADVDGWQRSLRGRLREILALPDSADTALAPVVEAPELQGDHTRQRIQFVAEPGETVPGYLLRPVDSRGPLPLMICLQGHSPGMHLSIGEARNEAEAKAIAGGRDLALQAVRQGWAALAIEQRAFGLRARAGVRCNDAALHALHYGRPLTGQRVFDVMRAIDFAATQPDLDPRRIACMGNSTGGTVSFYAACVEPRLRLAVVSCSFCTFAESWLSRPHCACGYLPGIMQVADMPDLAGLIAPRRLLIVAGRTDPLASIEGVEQGFARAREIFAAAGHPERVRLVVGEGGHQFFPDLAWPVIRELMAA